MPRLKCWRLTLTCELRSSHEPEDVEGAGPCLWLLVARHSVGLRLEQGSEEPPAALFNVASQPMSAPTLDRSDLVSVTCSADAEPERCPKCGSDEVYLVLDNLPATYKLCGDCDHRWDVPA